MKPKPNKPRSSRTAPKNTEARARKREATEDEWAEAAAGWRWRGDEPLIIRSGRTRWRLDADEKR